MKVRHLIIVSVGRDEETAEAVEALVVKYNSRPEVFTIAQVSYRDADPGTLFKKNLRKASGGDFSGEVGAYFVFHYGFGMEGRYSSSSGGSDTDGNAMAELFFTSAYQGLPFKQISKLCLVACKVTSPEANGAEYFAEHFCNRLARLCTAGSTTPPLVAGWDSFLTVSSPENNFSKSRSTRFRKPQDTGRKVATNKTGTNYKWASDVRGLHKWVWVWDGASGTVQKKRVADSDWSIGIMARRTTDDHTALIATGDLQGAGADASAE